MERTRVKDTFKRMSKNLRISLRTSSIVSDHLKSDYIEPEHLLAGILLNENALATKIVSSMGLNIQDVVGRILGSLGMDITVNVDIPMEISLSLETKDILRKAYSWSQRFSHVYVGTEHVMLAILESKNFFTSSLNEIGLTQKRFEKYLFEYATYPLGILSKPKITVSGREEGKLLDVIG
ncbi:MAG TPA: Clp protease N-terminal domain-containing protein, partial [Candidatus Dojkabacteria bacterium]|nr:Clp protease N-terminal domain-containing protein [Candidatus Dojkabacteria bacterium]